MDEPAMTGPAPDDEPADGDVRRNPDDEDVDPPVQRHLDRAALYGLCAGTFVYPDGDAVDDLAAPDVRESARAAGERLGLGDVVEPFLDALTDADADRLAREYDRTFGVPDDGGYPVSPYEAAYTEGDDVGHQQRRIASVVGLLESVGLAVDEAFHERQDHVAVELELMQVLAAQEATARHEGEADAAARVAAVRTTVLDRNLVDFVPAFAHDVREASDHPVYRTGARLAARLVERDHAAAREESSDDDGAGGTETPDGDVVA